MKKLMIAAVAMAGLTAMAGTGITSQNIVGYQTIDLAENTSLIAPTFNNVTSEKLTLNEMVPSRTDGDIDSYDIQLQTIDDSGVGDLGYYWLLADEAYVGSPEGWYDDNVELADKEFDFGEGIMLTCAYDDAKFTMSGSVDQQSATIPLPENTSILGNTRPVALDFSKVTPARESGEDIDSYDIQMQTIDDSGVGDLGYYWLLADEAYVGSPAGWYDDNVELADLTLQPGEAIIMTSAYDDAYLTIPAIK